MLEARGIEKRYKGRTVVQGVDLSISSGEVVGLLGPNGAGKTTAFHMIVGLVAPTRGEIYLDGVPITHLSMPLRARQGIGYLPQESSVFRKLTVEENLLAILETLPLTRQARKDRMKALLEEFHLLHLAPQRADTLSGGERRRLEIARALVRSPRFLLLDEPLAGVDPIRVSEMQTMIGKLAKSGIGIFITDHHIREMLKITDRAYMIHAGAILASGTPSDLVHNEEAKALYLGEEAASWFSAVGEPRS